MVVQLLTKIVVDILSYPHNVRSYFIRQKVFQKVVNLGRFKSRFTNVEIVKFVKAIMTSKDKVTILYFIKHCMFDKVIRIF